MDGAAAFAAFYATFAELAALGINRVGVISARRRPGAADSDDAMPWPHVGSLALHRVIAGVAEAAAVLLVLVMAVLHHGAADLTVLAVPLGFGLVLLGRDAAEVKRVLVRGDQ
jgi:hypothetical protein